jgi:hypothetical protein
MVPRGFLIVRVRLITRELELIDHSTSYVHIALDTETELTAERVWVGEACGIWRGLGSLGIPGQGT